MSDNSCTQSLGPHEVCIKTMNMYMSILCRESEWYSVIRLAHCFCKLLCIYQGRLTIADVEIVNQASDRG